MKGYTMWFQPYEHREAYVQTRSRRPPHEADASSTYAGLVAEARRVEKDGMVIVTPGDFDYRELVLNWWLHAKQATWRQYPNPPSGQPDDNSSRCPLL